MMSFRDFSCSECRNSFSCASQLLQHFAQHVEKAWIINENSFNNDKINEYQFRNKKGASDIPDLYPIKKVKKPELPLNSNVKKMLQKIAKEEDTVDSGIEDFVNPLNYCEVTISELDEKQKGKKVDNKILSKSCASKVGFKRKKYLCPHCQRCFGWSTDLKRHILIHTGDRPFKCSACPLAFTRKFLLQKHIHRVHNNDKSLDFSRKKLNLPILSPLKLANKNEFYSKNSHFVFTDKDT